MAFDTETSGLFEDDGARCAVVSVAWFDDELGDEDGIVHYAFPFDVGSRDKLSFSQGDLFALEDVNLPEEEWQFLLEWLSHQYLIAHNLKFDLHKMYVGTREWDGADLSSVGWWCTMVGQNVLEGRYGVSLEETAARLGLRSGKKGDEVVAWLRHNHKHLGIKKWSDAKGRYDLVPWHILGPYADEDAVLCLLVWARQWNLIDEGWCRPARWAYKMKVTRALFRMERRGVGYDAAASLEAARALRTHQRGVAAKLPFKATLPAAKKWFFTGEGLGHLPYKTSDGGGPALDEEVLRKMLADQLPHAKEWGEWVDINNACSRWYEGYPALIGEDGRLRASFNQVRQPNERGKGDIGARSERFSAQRIQLHAIPKRDYTNPLWDLVRSLDQPHVRDLFVARPGYVLYNLDLQQAELRVAAHYAQCKKMLEMIAAGTDLHGYTTREIFKIDEDHPGWASYRDMGKRCTFSGIFQIGPATFQADLSRNAGVEITIREAEDVVFGWRKLYPEYGRAYRQCEREAEVTGGVRVLQGTEFQAIHPFRMGDYTHTGWSRKVQGSLAEFLQIWLTETEDYLATQPGCEEGLILTVHDSLVLELPEDTGDDVAAAVSKLGADRGTELFGIEMAVDFGLWHKK